MLYLICYEEIGNEERSVKTVIPVISTRVPDPVGSAFWSGLENSALLSFQITALSLQHVMNGMKWGSPGTYLALITSILTFLTASG